MRILYHKEVFSVMTTKPSKRISLKKTKQKTPLAALYSHKFPFSSSESYKLVLILHLAISLIITNRMSERLFRSAISQDLDIIAEEAEILDEAKREKRRLQKAKSSRKPCTPSLEDSRAPMSWNDRGAEDTLGKEARGKHTHMRGNRHFTLTDKVSPRNSEDCRGAELSIYSTVFEDIIKNDSLYGVLLVNVKHKYDEYVTAVTEELADLKGKRIGELKTEILTLKSRLDMSEKQCEATITEKTQLEQVIMNERKSCNDTINLITKDLKASRMRESKYKELVKAMRKQGYPVDEVYENYVKRPQPVPILKIGQDSRDTIESCSISPTTVSSNGRQDTTMAGIIIPRRRANENYYEQTQEFSERN